MYVKPTKRPPFDVRRTVPGIEEDFDLAQVACDAINRTYILIGDLAFDRLFAARWKDILPEIAGRVSIAYDYELIAEPNVAADLLGQLATGYPELNWIDYLDGKAGAEHTAAITRTLIQLRRVGIQLPFLMESSTENSQVREAIAGLMLPEAVGLSYGSLFAGEELELSDAEAKALRRAHKTGVAPAGATYYCCSGGVCVISLKSATCFGRCSMPGSVACGHPG